VTKNDVQTVHRQPAHKLTNDDATDESLLWRHNGVIIGHSIPKQARNIFNYPPACLVHCDGACQKLRNQVQNFLKYTNKTSGTFFRVL